MLLLDEREGVEVERDTPEPDVERVAEVERVAVADVEREGVEVERVTLELERVAVAEVVPRLADEPAERVALEPERVAVAVERLAPAAAPRDVVAAALRVAAVCELP